MDLRKRFRYEIPTAIEFGCGSIQTLADHVKALCGSRVLVVADPGVVKAGVVERVTEPLRSAGIPYDIFSDIESDPDIASVEKGTGQARDGGCDLIVGVGGGSSLDTAKAIGIMLTNGGHIRDYVGLGKVKNRPAPVIAVPTTAGTGSELTIWSVLSDKERKVKLSVGSVYNCPALALLDPELTVPLPPHVTAFTGMDALTHAIESYVNLNTQPISEGMSVQAMKLIAANLRTAVANGNNLEARANMLLASTIAAMAFNATRLGLAHALALPLGAHFGIPHGLVNAMLLPEVMRYNLIGNLQKFAEIAAIFGERTEHLSLREAAERSVEAVRRLNRDIGITQTLGDFGVREEHLDMIANEAMESGNVPVNPVRATAKDLIGICRRLLGD
ncbi:MAG: alcohol dehydrogenase [Thermobacillus sp. ZCTH02-B1]|uniref:iron-containing alcohol dehydrogenase n=1 Tax=Thermobacillus sp. ZCTH02-B1 TaxID=1858795 RepID=UPI000B55D575|nr:iron-containing alcohol dehydrogenase [Thermobacillus sp. ZCTH02-B1]OUM95767.1 MAG: alcohol dehydrogenase [Thermobacillus sp. ZCTH02-B1]